MNNNEITFNENKVKDLLKKDRLLNFVFNDLIDKGHEKKFALKVIFNGYILGDSQMEKVYENK